MSHSAKQSLIRVTEAGETFDFHTHPKNELVSDIIRERGRYSHNDLTIMRRLIRSGDCVVDIGANIGWYTVFFSRWVGESGIVFAIEPDPKNAEILRRNIQTTGYANTKVVEQAMGERHGDGFLFQSETNSGDHSLGRGSEAQKSIEISLETLSHLFDASPQVRLPNFLKIDAQGSEPKILQGAKKIFETAQPAIMIEYSPSHIYRCGSSPFELFAFIENHHHVPFRQLGDGEEFPDGKLLEFLTPQRLFRYHEHLVASELGIDILLLPPSRVPEISDSVGNLV